MKLLRDERSDHGTRIRMVPVKAGERRTVSSYVATGSCHLLHRGSSDADILDMISTQSSARESDRITVPMPLQIHL